jgi:hypothetical protein
LIGINELPAGEPHAEEMDRRSFLLGAGGMCLAVGAAGIGWRGLVGSMTEYDASAAELRADLMPSDIHDVIRYASLAANSHNTQPWRFRIGDRTIDVLPDFSRRTPAVDPDDHRLFVSLGCAAANLELAATASGRPGECIIAPDGNSLRYQIVCGTPNPQPLSVAISRRQSTRAEYDGRSIASADLDLLRAAAALPDVTLVLLVSRAQISKVRDLVVAANSEQMADAGFMRELKHWLRFNPRSAMASGDGLFSAASGNPSLPTVLGEIAVDQFLNARSEGARYARQIDSSAGIAIFVGDEESRRSWIRVGQACQRFALTATTLGLKLAFVNQPVEVARWRTELAGLIGTRKRPDIVLRFGHGRTLPYSLRRPVASVIA